MGGIVKDGLILDLDAGKLDSYNRLGTTWNDISGNGNNGTLTNFSSPSPQTIWNGDNGGSIIFDGTNDYVGWNTFSAVKQQNWSSITMETTFKLVSYVGGTSGRQYIFDNRDVAASEGAVSLFHDSSVTPLGLKLYYNTVGASYEEPLITTIPLNSLIFYQVVFDKTTSTNNIKHFVNGVNVLTRSVTVTQNTAGSGRVWMGRWSGGGYQWNGNIYSYRIYNRKLTDSEITQNYNALKGRYI